MSVVESRAAGRLWERHPLAVAVALSLVIHAGLYGGWQLGKQFGWQSQTPAWLTHLTRKLASPAKARSPREKEEQAIPMTFVEVDPETATVEPPEKAKYYSSKNSKASNPDPKEQQLVKVDGKQDKVVRLMENEKPNPVPLQPAPKPAPPEPPAEPKPKTDTPGDLALVRPREPKPPSDGELDTGTGVTRDRPRLFQVALGASLDQRLGLGLKVRMIAFRLAHINRSEDSWFIAAVVCLRPHQSRPHRRMRHVPTLSS
jgi:hypothetical protein